MHADDNVIFDSDEEDDSAANGNALDPGGLASFPVDNWEDTWDDSDAPVSGQVCCFCYITVADDNKTRIISG